MIIIIIIIVIITVIIIIISLFTSSISVNDFLWVKLIFLWSLFKLIKLEPAKNNIKKYAYNIPSFENEDTKRLDNSII